MSKLSAGVESLNTKSPVDILLKLPFKWNVQGDHGIKSGAK